MSAASTSGRLARIKGKNDRQFDDPYAVAVSPEGRVYVSDTNNDRIQLFK